MRVISLILILGIFFSSLTLAGDSFSIEETIKKVFPNAQESKEEIYSLDNQELKVFTILANNEVLGFSVVLDEMGKNKPITFLVGIDIKGYVLGIFLLEFRDIFGGEIRRRSFLRQFQGKSLNDPLNVGRDIDSVTGATISSQAACSAVKKTLKLVEEIPKR